MPQYKKNKEASSRILVIIVMASFFQVSDNQVFNCNATQRENPVNCGGQVCVHGDCLFQNDTGLAMENCECYPGWEGSKCDTCLPSSTEAPVTVTDDAHVSDGINDTTTPKNDIVCVARDLLTPCINVICSNGDCVELNTTKGLEYGICHCDPAWTGSKCDTCCDLPCKNNGKCTSLSSDTGVCECYGTGFHGQFCEIPSTHTGEETLVSVGPEDINCTAGKNYTPCASIQCKNGVCKNLRTPSGMKYGICSCDGGWTGTQCDIWYTGICCDRPCQNNGKCTVVKGDTQICNCTETAFQGPYCDIMAPEDTPGPVKAVSSAGRLQILAVVLAVLLAIIQGIVVVVWIVGKRRSTFRKSVSRFAKYEKEETKYDVMILFSSNHEVSCHLVTSELLPAIEDLGLIVCSNQPDILPQHATEESLHKASQESKRILLLLSKQLIEEYDSVFEGATESTDMLEALDVDRTVTIVVDALDDDLRSCIAGVPVSYILESVVCLHYPQHQTAGKTAREFWKKLKLCLPRKRSEISVGYFSV